VQVRLDIRSIDSHPHEGDLCRASNNCTNTPSKRSLIRRASTVIKHNRHGISKRFASVSRRKRKVTAMCMSDSPNINFQRNDGDFPFLKFMRDCETSRSVFIGNGRENSLRERLHERVEDTKASCRIGKLPQHGSSKSTEPHTKAASEGEREREREREREKHTRCKTRLRLHCCTTFLPSAPRLNAPWSHDLNGTRIFV
jgi:hypothetical protein